MNKPDYVDPTKSLYGLEDWEPFGEEAFPIGVPFNSPNELKLYILAAMKTYFSGRKSIDKMLKEYGPHWQSKIRNRTSDEKELDNMLFSVKLDVISVIKQMSTPRHRPKHTGLFAAEAAIMRLHTSFRTAILLVRQRQLFETAAIIRLIFEQLAWIYTIYKIADDSLFRIKPTTTISKLKEVFPRAGIIYGILSELAHITPDNTPYYIHTASEDIMIRFNSPKTKYFMTYLLITVADLYRIIAEITSADYMDELKAIERHNDGNIELKKERPLRPIMEACKMRVDEELINI